RHHLRIRKVGESTEVLLYLEGTAETGAVAHVCLDQLEDVRALHRQPFGAKKTLKVSARFSHLHRIERLVEALDELVKTTLVHWAVCREGIRAHETPPRRPNRHIRPHRSEKRIW